jgi:hypothetical protein
MCVRIGDANERPPATVMNRRWQNARRAHTSVLAVDDSRTG